MRLNCAASFIASSECPPSAKKSASTSFTSQSSKAAKDCAMVVSVPVRGARPETRDINCGIGSALRSSLPFALSGNSASCNNTVGTMCAGSFSRRRSRNTVVSSGKPDCDTRYPTSWRASPPVAAAWLNTQAWATACSTSGNCCITRSISPSSMRCPRILSWSSLRPRYSTAPFSSQRATSPVRYIRSPTLNGSAIKRLAVRSGRPR